MFKTPLIAAACLFAVSASAGDIITVTGTIDSRTTSTAYSVGDPFSITITLSSFFVVNPGSNFDSSTLTTGNTKIYNEWGCYGSSVPRLVESVSFTGATGTYVSDTCDDLQFLKWLPGYSTTTDLFLSVTTSPDAASTLAVGSSKVSSILYDAVFFGRNTLTGFGSESDIYKFLANNYGTYASSILTGSDSHITLANNQTIYFSPSSITIAAAPVPEPSTEAGLAGLSALGAVALLRRKRK